MREEEEALFYDITYESRVGNGTNESIAWTQLYFLCFGVSRSAATILSYQIKASGKKFTQTDEEKKKAKKKHLLPVSSKHKNNFCVNILQTLHIVSIVAFSQTLPRLLLTYEHIMCQSALPIKAPPLATPLTTVLAVVFVRI